MLVMLRGNFYHRINHYKFVEWAFQFYCSLSLTSVTRTILYHNIIIITNAYYLQYLVDNLSTFRTVQSRAKFNTKQKDSVACKQQQRALKTFRLTVGFQSKQNVQHVFRYIRLQITSTQTLSWVIYEMLSQLDDDNSTNCKKTSA